MPHVPPSREQLLVHFYRAVVMHADVWRQRMDATTNWAAATSAVMITFAFGAPESPHFVLVIALAFGTGFLIMESRRYQTYDLWRYRFRLLNRYLIAPALRGEHGEDEDVVRSRASNDAGLQEVAEDMSHTVPHMRLTAAVAYRVRRNYGFLFAVLIGAWVLKLDIHPEPAVSFAELVSRAALGPISGTLVFSAVSILVMGLIVLAASGPSERMREWQSLPSPIARVGAAGFDALTRDQGGS